MAASTMLRSAGAALRRSTARVLAGEQRLLRRPLVGSRQRSLSSGCAGNAQANKHLHSNLNVSEQKNIIMEEEQLFHKRLSSYMDALSRSVQDQARLIKELETQIQNNKRFDEIKQFQLVLLIPASFCAGIILEKKQVFG